MDAAAKRYTGPGHRLFHHTLDTATMFENYFKKFDPVLARQARLEVALHIAFDRGLINARDVALMRDYTKAQRLRRI
ncbi:MAG: hypothetical protein FJ135_04390 [Deltaproteobacteria bacterium]|nr:hypothetical protein [Deltaproteobacteria bacterium]